MRRYRKAKIKLNPLIKKIAAINAALLVFVTIFSNRSIIAAPLAAISSKMGAIAAAIIVPDGLVQSVLSVNSDGKQNTAQGGNLFQNFDFANEKDNDSQNQKNIINGEKPAATTADSTKSRAVVSNAKGKISVQTIGYSGANMALDNLHISNNTGLKIDLNKQLSIKPNIKMASANQPQVLIIHTHATECYYETESSVYPDDWEVKTKDTAKNMVSVGNEFANVLKSAGIKTLHDTTLYDKDAYSGSYERARVKTQEWLKKYPSIQMVLDLHRDSITYDNGTKLRPITTIDGKKAAQIMICTGSNSGKVSGYDNWMSNFRFAIRLQQSCEKNYKNLARPLYFVSKKYNHDLCSGSLLIEIGSEANTLSEAKYSARLTAQALINVLQPLK